MDKSEQDKSEKEEILKEKYENGNSGKDKSEKGQF